MTSGVFEYQEEVL